MIFYILYIFLVLILYFSYVSQKLSWQVEIRYYIYAQIKKFSVHLSQKNIEVMEEDFTEVYKKNKDEIDATTETMIMKSLKIKNFYFSLLNPFMNNILSQVKNKGLLLKILETNGEIK